MKDTREGKAASVHELKFFFTLKVFFSTSALSVNTNARDSSLLTVCTHTHLPLKNGTKENKQWISIPFFFSILCEFLQQTFLE